MFGIVATDEPVTDGAPALCGKILVGDLQETFIASLASWSREQYELQWTKALERLTAGTDRSALITDFVEYSTRVTREDYLVWWPLYRDGGDVYVQNHLLFLHQLERPFSLERYWDSVRDRQVVNCEGQKISEWRTTVQDIRNFLNSKRGKIAPSSY